MSGEPEPRLPEMANAPIVRELGSREQWVCWKFQKRNGKSTKIPINPNTGQPASVTKPEILQNTLGNSDNFLISRFHGSKT